MKNIHKIFGSIFLVSLIMGLSFKKETIKTNENAFVLKPDSLIKIDRNTGLKIAEHFDLIVANCTGCHSAKIITQFHTDKKGWLEKIRWMQQKQNLWDLGELEPKILDYLSKNYPPNEKVNRRAPLKKIAWYKFKK